MTTRVPDVLAQILQSTREQVRRRRAAVPAGQLEELAPARPFPYAEVPGAALRSALARPGMSVIAEFKRRSPSAGAIRPGAQVAEVVRAYREGGAAAISVLTEEAHFEGSLDDLRAARAASDLPLLRKDFIVDPYQLHEARAGGADAVLLIVAALDDGELGELHAAAGELGLEALVEVHGLDELDRALAVEPALLGVNNRDLRDFSVDPRRTLDVAGRTPPGVTLVAESGVGSREQLQELLEAGVNAVLIGEALMRQPDPAAALRGLLNGLGTP